MNISASDKSSGRGKDAIPDNSDSGAMQVQRDLTMPERVAVWLGIFILASILQSVPALLARLAMTGRLENGTLESICVLPLLGVSILATGNVPSPNAMRNVVAGAIVLLSISSLCATVVVRKRRLSMLTWCGLCSLIGLNYLPILLLFIGFG